jgi:hypothetical protein
MRRTRTGSKPSKDGEETLRLIGRAARRTRKQVRKRQKAKLRYAVGDQCYISVNFETVRAVVIASFTHPSFPNTFYICKLPDEHPFLEIRDALTMKPNKDDPYPFWQHTEAALPKAGH